MLISEHFIGQLKIPNHLCHSSQEYFSQSQCILLATCLGKDDTAPNYTVTFAGINGKYALMRDPVLRVNTHTCVIRSEWVKGGSSSDPNCYRPISILPCLAKVLEKLVLKQLEFFLTTNHILSDFQSGFRSGHG